MPQFWVPASKARSLVAGEGGDDYGAGLAICSRAHAGLLQSMADLLIVGDKRAEQSLIPSGFWWAEGFEALDQDWARGDFGTWIEQNVQMRAFGVRFDFDGLCKLLAPEVAAAALRQTSVSADPNWVSASDARRFFYEKLGANPATAGAEIVERCRLGFVPARAQLMQRSDSGRPESWTAEEREWDVPDWFWQNFTREGSSTQDFQRGIFNGRGRAPHGSCWIRLTGVYFAKASLGATGESSVDSPEIAPNKGGRPRKDFWDDLWCAVWGEVYRGSLKPKNQAEIERAMMEWVESRNETVSESTIKPLARKMFIEMQR